MTDQTVPQNLEAEENVLGAMLVSPNAIEKVIDVLEPSDFYRESHGLIYRAILGMHSLGQGADPITVANELEQQGQLTNAGGKVRLHELARVVPATANVKHYAEIVRDKSTARGLIKAGNEIAQLGWDSADKSFERAEEIVLGLAPRHTSHATVYTATEVVNGFKAKLKDAANFFGEDILGVPTPWSFLGPMKGSRLYTLAGYTSDGKSASALQFFSTACGAGHRGMLVSNEMSEEDLTARLVSQAGVPHHMCDSGQVELQYQETMAARLEEIARWEFKLVDDEGIGLAGIRRHIKLYRPEFVIIDHLHQFAWSERRELEMLILGFRSLAREYEIPVLLLAQLSRSGDKFNPFPRPNLTMLKETSMLEQSSDAVWFVWRPRDEFFQPQTHTEFLVAKNRGGALTYENLEFVPQFVRFDERKP